MTLIAKPIVKNQLWVITDGVTKIGNVEADGSGFNVKIGDTQSHFTSTESIEEIVKLEFERPPKAKKKSEIPYAHWPTTGKTHNNFYDVKRKIHVYTKTADSKCYYAAGYYKMLLNDQWQTVFCPKYILVQRYPYSGPYISEQAVPQE
jgi:hypothetical protein